VEFSGSKESYSYDDDPNTDCTESDGNLIQINKKLEELSEAVTAATKPIYEQKRILGVRSGDDS